jgi:hypothetical protein
MPRQRKTGGKLEGSRMAWEQSARSIYLQPEPCFSVSAQWSCCRFDMHFHPPEFLPVHDGIMYIHVERQAGREMFERIF